MATGLWDGTFLANADWPTIILATGIFLVGLAIAFSGKGEL